MDGCLQGECISISAYKSTQIAFYRTTLTNCAVRNTYHTASKDHSDFSFNLQWYP